MRAPHLALLGAALLAGALTVACGGDDDAPAQTQSIDSSSESGNATGTTAASNGSDGGSGDETATGGGQGSGGSDGKVLGTARATLSAGPIDERTIPIRMDVTRLERHGDLVELTLLLTNEAPNQGDEPPGFGIYDRFGDGPSDYNASGIGLVDGDAQKEYLPVLDSEGACLCSNDFGANDIPPGGSRTITATYGGVPDDVEQLDVKIPTFPTIAGVAVQ
jgi:hypothetical protein